MKPYFDKSSAAWLWLFPMTYFVHMVEEYCGVAGFFTNRSRLGNINLTPAQFLIISGVAFVLMNVGVILAWRFKFPEWMLACLGTVVVINGLTHTISSLINVRYDPGLISGVLLWIPLGIMTLIHLKGRMHPRRYSTAIMIGVAIHGVVSLLALKGGKLF